jgi:hypothetical protein
MEFSSYYPFSSNEMTVAPILPTTHVDHTTCRLPIPRDRERDPSPEYAWCGREFDNRLGKPLMERVIFIIVGL